ncbi:MAG: asparagine--tRNA ligase, partial [Phaeodactylibacter sp.]|nr:asparagine--tRNA ligase [Phaeodactylibacter sp.]
TPIITGSDAEGAGEMFRVTNFDISNPPRTEEGEVDFQQDFFGKATNLTVSGQLQAEIGALALGKVYTFGPTFRAENSNTSRHLAEFWMIEPEVAFYDIFDNMDLAEDFSKYLINYVLDNYKAELEFLDQRIQKLEQNMPKNDRRPMGLIETLRFVVDNDFERITYSEAVNILRNSKPYKKGKFEYDVEWGKDLQAEHERFLVEKKFKKPVIVRDYPASIKAFYMRMNDEQEGVPGKTVAAMDVLFPGIGEVVGGSQREERLDVLKARMADMDIPEEELWWYLELRKFGGAPHAGFGLGFERIVQFITGMGNIRDVIAFPRTPGNAEF